MAAGERAISSDGIVFAPSPQVGPGRKVRPTPNSWRVQNISTGPAGATHTGPLRSHTHTPPIYYMPWLQVHSAEEFLRVSNPLTHSHPDDLVWSVIGTDFCSFKLKTTKDQTFCRNEHNVSGFCSKQACPLANSRYATIRADPATGALYLYIKAIERAHLPSKWWEKIKLPSNYTKALELVDQHLAYFPKFLVHKNKQRLTRLTQVNIRIRKLAKEDERLGERLVPRLAPKVRRREEGRERKALAAAKVERAIERVLIERLRSGAYGDRPLNVEPNVWKKVMRGLEKEGQAERDQDLDDGLEDEDDELECENEMETSAGQVEYVSDIEGESDEEMEDFEDWIGGQSADEDSDGDEESGSASGSQDDDSDNDDGDDNESAKEDTEALKKALANLKRKRPAGPPPKPKKKPSKDSKGPKRGIEYEIEREPATREAMRI